MPEEPLPVLSRRSFVGVGVAAVAGAVTTGLVDSPARAASSHATDVSRPWLDAWQDPALRARLLVERMTLDEKIAMLHGQGYPPAGPFAGSIPANTRLGIPALILSDGPDGVGDGTTGVTQWPAAVNQASTWDTALVGEFGRASGAEHAAKGRNIALAPTINILRRPNWGRAFETYTEDPYLNGQLASATIRGVQDNHIIATVKHFAANNQEVQRSSVNVVVSRRALEEIYFPGFKAAVQQGETGAVMGAYNKVNGAFCCENPALLTDALRGEWGYTGFVMSDWFATHSTLPSVEAGLDMEMPGGNGFLYDEYFDAPLKTAVQNGQVTEGRLDSMVTAILTSMFRVGLFEYPTPDPTAVESADVSTSAHLDLATRLSEQGTVLLKNEHALLPLDPRRVRRIAVIGDAASTNPKTAGGGSAGVTPSAPIVSPLAAITARASGVEIDFARGTLGTAALAPIPSSALTPKTGSGSGLTGTYYATVDFTGTPLGTETDAKLDFTATPAIVGTAAAWSAVWTGTLTAPATGDYRFSIAGGGAAQLIIDGALVVDFVPGYEAVFNGLTHLAAGDHTVKATYSFQQLGLALGGTGLQVGWQPQEDQLIAQAVAAARAADVAIVFAADATSEGMDRLSLALPADQDRLIAAVAAANPNTVVVLNTSAAVLMPWAESVPAILEAWYGGQNAGTAMARILFGDVNPSGKLTHTFPASEDQGPARTALEYPGDGTNVYYDEGILVGYRWFDDKDLVPLYPFGHGLSYTDFQYSDLRIENTAGEFGQTAVKVQVTVANVGGRPGAEITQLYLSSPASADEPPKQLKGFTKTYLAAGERRTLTFTLDRDALSAWSDSAGGWTVFPGRYQVSVGGSSADLPLSGSFHIA